MGFLVMALVSGQWKYYVVQLSDDDQGRFQVWKQVLTVSDVTRAWHSYVTSVNILVLTPVPISQV